MKNISYIVLLCPSLLAAEISWFSGLQQADVSAELLSSDDIEVQSYRVAYLGTEGPWTIDASLGLNRYSLDYVPVLFGTNTNLQENAYNANLGLTRKWNDHWQSGVTLGFYEGFSEYRSIWIAEFYRQFFGSFPEYASTDPSGAAFGASTTWNYLPGTGLAEFSLRLARDHIAPGWEFNPELGVPTAGNDELNSLTGILRIEQALNGWLKTELALSARSLTDRETRYSVRNSWAAAAGPVGIRLTGGYTEEAPAFDAFYGSALIEWNISAKWNVFVGYRAYNDSGEIEATGFNAQAPGLDSTEIFAGVLWDRGDLSVSGTVGYLETDYAELSEDNRFFGNLYRDRDWLTLRLAASYSF